MSERTPHPPSGGAGGHLLPQGEKVSGPTFGLTARQAELLGFIRGYIARAGVAPSYDEMAAALGLKNRGNIPRMIAALEERGRIVRLSGRARSLAVVER